ncbi:PH domain-containing protein [Streptomyces sp. NPDC001508]|uniref:PH domain-containing protein n=1 Tax=Streptomyces sp. NPDC001508 TaxID=3154656 RepID=UPI00331A9478
MTTPDHQPSEPQPPVPTVKDRVHRSSAAIAGGVVMLAIVLWLGLDALFNGHGRTPWLALATMILVVPLVVAFTLRPAVYAGEDRLRVRNPFRMITLPWGEIAALRSSYSNEVVAESGTKYQLWAVPVSLRARKRAARRQTRSEAAARDGGGRSGGPGTGPGAGGGVSVVGRAEGDQIVEDLRELLERRGQAEGAQGEIVVRWAYEVVVPAVAGAVLLVILLAMG